MGEKMRDWIVTTLLALSVAVLDIYFYVSTYLNDPAQKVAVIGIITFFGLMVSSAYHEYAKDKIRKETEEEADDKGKKDDKSLIEDKEIMRTAIAGTLIVIYIVVLATSIFTNPLSSDKDTVFKTTFDNFGNVIIVVVGFYFGSKGAIQIFRMYRNSKDDQSDTSDGKDTNKPTNVTTKPKPGDSNIQTVSAVMLSPELQPGYLANRLNHDFTVIYANAMASIEPKDLHSPDFKKRHDSWAKAFRFTQSLRSFINDFDSNISLAGGPNTSGDFTKVTQDFATKLRNDLDSNEFQRNMEISKPSIDDPNLLRIWQNAFTFPQMLEEFGTHLEDIIKREGGKISFQLFLARLKHFLDTVEEQLGLPPPFFYF